MENNLITWCRNSVSITLHNGRRICTETCWEDDVFPPSDLWFVDTNTKCAVIYNLYLDVWWGVIYI